MKENKTICVTVTDAPYYAKGDGETNDRKAIQQAIDDVFAQGGGIVELPAGKTFLSGGLILRSNITLQFGEGTVLLQSSDPNDYVKPVEEGYESYKPAYGYNLEGGVKWAHIWYYNYPMLFAGEGTHDVKIAGKGTVRMMSGENPDKLLRICPIGFYRVSRFEIADITITNYHTYGMMIFTCDHGLISNVTIGEWSYGNSDGVNLLNCQDIRVTGCHMNTCDDSLYIFSSYRDPRGGGWWSSDIPQPTRNIEIDHNDLASNHCKAFAMILWGLDCPDLEQVEVRNVYIHDNHFKSMGNWLYNPYTEKTGFPPVTNVRFENNRIDAIEQNFFDTAISDMNYFHSMTSMHNGDFEEGGLAFWSMRKNSNEDSVGVGRDAVGQDGAAYGYIAHLEEGDAAIYQGLYIKAGEPCNFGAKVQSSGNLCRMFVRDLETQELVASKDFCNTQWKEEWLEFTVPKSGNYHIGIERGKADSGWARIDNAMLLGNYEPAFGYSRVILDGKVIYIMEKDK